MPPWRYRVIYFVLLPAIAIATGILGYYTWVSASGFARLGEQTIADSTLLLVREKVESIERYVITQDNLAFGLVELADGTSIESKWLPVAEQVTPSIHALLLLDDAGEVLGYANRGNEREAARFLKVFEERMLGELELQRLTVGRLKHLHQSFGNKSYLLSYEARRHAGRRVYLVAHHDTEYIVEEEFPRLFATEEGKRQYNVVSDDNRRVYGPSLANAGDYLVGHRFPTTLYAWRLQVAPKQAPLLERQGRSRRATDLALLGIAFLVVLLGVFFLLYAAHKERQLNALKGEFIANVSHELKTPLSVVRMFGEMLASDRVRSEEKRQQYLEIIVRESERLTTLIDNVLDFSALERGRPMYAMRQRDLEEVVNHALETFRYRVEREGVEIQLDVRGELPPVKIDEQAFVLALVNLLDNAMKYGERTPITVTLEHVRDFVQVRVRDRGPGIPPQSQKRVFERFFRGRRESDVRGSGIGLALVRHIAQAHGGRAWAVNSDEEEGGAVVSFAIPALAAGAARDADVSDPGSSIAPESDPAAA